MTYHLSHSRSELIRDANARHMDIGLLSECHVETHGEQGETICLGDEGTTCYYYTADVWDAWAALDSRAWDDLWGALTGLELEYDDLLREASSWNYAAETDTAVIQSAEVHGLWILRETGDISVENEIGGQIFEAQSEALAAAQAYAARQ